MLTKLNLRGTGVTDVSFLGQCKMLTELKLCFCSGLTDVSGLGQCKMLTELDLSRCSNITQENVDSLKEKLPDCEISYY